MKANRRLLWIFLLLCPLFWLALPSRDETGKEVKEPSGKKIQDAGARARDGGRDNLSMQSPRRSSRAQASNGEGVDRILADDAISPEQAAIHLREIAINPRNSLEKRLEALEHGLNLNAESFFEFAQQKDLPPKLASCYLHEIINHHGSPAIQIRSYMALMNHRDAEVAELAKDMLTSEVGDELQEPTREQLLAAAQSKLAELASEAGK